MSMRGRRGALRRAFLDIARHTRPPRRVEAKELRGGRVLTPEGAVDRSLVVARGRIRSIGGLDHSAPWGDATVIDVSGRLVLPGMINAHDHLDFDHYPRTGRAGDGGAVYPDWLAWAKDITARHHEPSIQAAMAVPRPEALVAGAYKNLLAGVTTVCHHGHRDSWMRALEPGLPVRLVRRLGVCHSLQQGGDVAASYAARPSGAPWIIHLAEGTSEAMFSDLDALDKLGAVGADTVLVHGIGLSASDIARLASEGAAIVWCPASNDFLYGACAPVDRLMAAGVPVALGTDARISGSAHLLDELRAAAETGLATNDALFRMVTDVAARILRIEDRAGTLAIGRPADLIVLDPNFSPPTLPPRGLSPATGTSNSAEHAATALLSAQPEAIRLVLIGGRPMLAAPEYAGLCKGRAFTTIERGGERWLVAGRPSRVLRSLELLSAT